MYGTGTDPDVAGRVGLGRRDRDRDRWAVRVERDPDHGLRGRAVVAPRVGALARVEQP